MSDERRVEESETTIFRGPYELAWIMKSGLEVNKLDSTD